MKFCMPHFLSHLWLWFIREGLEPQGTDCGHKKHSGLAAFWSSMMALWTFCLQSFQTDTIKLTEIRPPWLKTHTHTLYIYIIYIHSSYWHITQHTMQTSCAAHSERNPSIHPYPRALETFLSDVNLCIFTRTNDSVRVFPCIAEPAWLRQLAAATLAWVLVVPLGIITRSLSLGHWHW